MTRPATFQKLLRRGHLRVASAAVMTFGCTLAVIAHVLMSGVQERHLELVARTLSYSVEAAITFRDEQTAAELLRDIAGREGLVDARVLLPDGAVLASHVTPDSGPVDRLMRRVGIPRCCRRQRAAFASGLGWAKRVSQGDSAYENPRRRRL